MRITRESALFDLKEIRAAIVEDLSVLGKAEELQVVKYMLALPTPPTIQVTGAGEILYDVAMQAGGGANRGGDQNDVVVQAFVSMVSDQAGQEKLDRLLTSSGPSSIKEAIEEGVALAAIVDAFRVTKCSGSEIYPRADQTVVVGASWTVQVETSG